MRERLIIILVEVLRITSLRFELCHCTKNEVFHPEVLKFPADLVTFTGGIQMKGFIFCAVCNSCGGEAVYRVLMENLWGVMLLLFAALRAFSFAGGFACCRLMLGGSFLVGVWVGGFVGAAFIGRWWLVPLGVCLCGPAILVLSISIFRRVFASVDKMIVFEVLSCLATRQAARVYHVY